MYMYIIMYESYHMNQLPVVQLLVAWLSMQFR